MSEQFVGDANEVVLSVIVPVKNGLPLLHDQFRALLSQPCDLPWEVVVADNGSTDGTADVVRSYAAQHPRVRLVDASSVAGPAATRNLGVRYARGDIFAFCDADDVVHPGWLNSWVSALADADIAGGLMDFWSLNGLPPPSPPEPRLPPAGRQFGFLEAAGSGNMAVRRHAFESVGGFDEDLPVGEDTDLSWRLQLGGYRFAFGKGVLSRREPSGGYARFRKSIQYGRCGPALYQRHRDAGLHRDVRGAIRGWLYLLVTTPLLVDPTFRRRWIFLSGWRLGRLVESCKRLVFFP